MTAPAFSITVYCGSRLGADPAFEQCAKDVGRWIGAHGGQLVYGGGKGGLMGVLADAALAAGARVLGFIPKALVEREWAHHGITELHIVQTMHERKSQMAAHGDAFLALPGGIGTFEELFEAWTWRQLGYHNKPIGLLNTSGYYDGLLAFSQHAVQSDFLKDRQMQMLHVSRDVSGLLKDLVQSAGLARQMKAID
jgi:uncharacterized protein (TIGR00730 family)